MINLFNDKNSKLLSAAESGNVEKVEKYIKQGADIETRNKVKYTPLLAAAFKGKDQVVKVLITNGAKLEATDLWGNTALHLATFVGNDNVVRLLLDSRANAYAKNKDGKYPSDLAATKTLKSIYESIGKSKQKQIDVTTKKSSFHPPHTPLQTFPKPDPSAPELPSDAVVIHRDENNDPNHSEQQMQVPATERAATVSSSAVSQNGAISRNLLTSDLPMSESEVLVNSIRVEGMSSINITDATNEWRSRIPDAFICPISMEMMTDPVITTAGQTYERKSIEEWFKDNNIDPVAHIPVVKILTPNIALKQQIQKFKGNFDSNQLDQIQSTESGDHLDRITDERQHRRTNNQYQKY